MAELGAAGRGVTVTLSPYATVDTMTKSVKATKEDVIREIKALQAIVQEIAQDLQGP